MPPSLALRPYAHRGLHDRAGAPENSLAAFRRAVAAGYGIELDVHLLADGGLAVFHDGDTKRMTGEPGSVGDHTRASLQPLRLAGTDEAIPLLETVLDLVGGAAPLLIELKNPPENGRAERRLGEVLAGYAGSAACQSFVTASLPLLRAATGRPCGLLLENPAGFDAAARSASPDFLGLRHDRLALSGRPPGAEAIPVLAWTVRSSAEAEAVADRADAFIFEDFRPDPAGRA